MIGLRILVVGRDQDRLRALERIERQAKFGGDVLHVLRRQLRQLVEREVVQVDANQIELAVERRAGLERVARRQRRRRERQLRRQVARRHAEVVERAGEQNRWRARVIGAGVAANHRLAIAPRIPCKPEARAELLGRVGDDGRVNPITHRELEALDQVDENVVVGLRAGIVLAFPAQAVVDRQVRTNAPCILPEERQFVHRE